MNLNSYRNALAWIAGLSIALGIILTIVGANIAERESNSYFGSNDPFAGLPQQVAGGSFFSLGVVSLLLWLTVSALIQGLAPAPAPTSTPAKKS